MRRTLIAILILTVTSSSSLAWWVRDEGEAIGFLTDLSHTGYVFKTWEVRLTLAGMQDGSGTFGGRSLYLTIDKQPELVKIARSAMIRRAQVKVHYRQEAIVAPWRAEMGSRRRFVISIEEIK